MKDTHALAATAIITVGLQFLTWLFSVVTHKDTLTDFSGSLNFVVIALYSFFYSHNFFPRQILTTVLIVVSRVELGAYLFTRVLRRGRDSRFDTLHRSAAKLLVFFIFQAIWAYTGTFATMFVNGDASDPELQAADWVGLGLWILGFACQVLSDFQKDAFRRNPANSLKACDAGLWKYSRHPNFFGEICMQWALFLIAVPVIKVSSDSWGYACLIGPLFTMFILLLGSGIPTAEGDNQRRFLKTPETKAAFLSYRRQTSPLIPLPPSIYRSIPLIIKRALLFELPLYETDWTWTPESSTSSADTGSIAKPLLDGRS